MCTIKKMSEMTGLSEDKFGKKRSKDEESILKALCMTCKRKKQESFLRIAKDFNLASHATVISNIQMVENNPNHPKVRAAKQTHKCFRVEPEPVCIIPATISEAKIIVRETLEDILDRTSVFSPAFEEIMRQIRNRDIRNSPQRITCKL